MKLVLFSFLLLLELEIMIFLVVLQRSSVALKHFLVGVRGHGSISVILVELAFLVWVEAKNPLELLGNLETQF